MDVDASKVSDLVGSSANSGCVGTLALRAREMAKLRRQDAQIDCTLLAFNMMTQCLAVRRLSNAHAHETKAAQLHHVKSLH